MSIYITQALLLSSDLYGVDIDPNNPRIGWNSALFNGTVTADSSDINYPASNILNESAGLYWRSNVTTAQSVYMNIIPQRVDYCGIAAHNLAGSVIQLQRRDDSGDPWVNVGSSFVPADNQAIMIYFQAVATSAFWRLNITPATGVKPRIGVIYLGEMLTLQRKIGVGHKPAVFNRKSEFYTGEAGGVFQGRVLESQAHEFEIPQNQVTTGYLYSVLKEWLDVAINRPFFFAWRPMSFPNEVCFSWLESDPSVTWLQSKNYGVTMKARAMVPLV
jgi:hypothetical protein